ncbi:MAG: chromosome segregation protein SMC [Proteobacteria bacterium]|nr:chromosome segregation protein SMC [Cystobacterineae bacterium]MCL2259337.1 chromosome segregation protein SMC [Cystobacterineae bacterium]MCL2313852.1 chromosome segregation protein SMC [Pseudomonadota bacterium]
MRIKRLDITGFKSFMQHSPFVFDKGITVVVGPNGCGKSNIVDAIRWVMGEQSAKNLRGRGMEDVIFAGSESHLPLSMAEVTMTFETEESDLLPTHLMGLPEVSITRRLFRNGDSEYQINKTHCRLLDITELFLGTGVGTRAYSIIEQGSVGQVVSARPEDRRLLLEEAAGVTKYKTRRKAAEKKMEHTQQNLLRIQDILGELKRNLGSLERAAKKAEKFRRLRMQLRKLESQDWAHRFLELKAVFSHADLQRQETEARAEGNSLALQQAQNLLGERRQEAEKTASELESEALALAELTSRIQLGRQNLKHGQADKEATCARQTKAETEQQQLQHKRERLEAEFAQCAEALQLLSASNLEEAKVVEEARLKREANLAQRNQLEAVLGKERTQLMQLATALAQQETQQAHLGQRKLELQQRLERLNQETHACEAEKEKWAKQLASLEAQHQQQHAAQEALLQGRQEEQRLQNGTQADMKKAQESLSRSREVWLSQRSRLASLQEICSNYEGFDRGVRALMKEKGKGEGEGILGLVADALVATPRSEKAIEAVLGEKLQCILLEAPQRAVELCTHLKEHALGRSSFFILPWAQQKRLPKPPCPEVVAMALDELQCTQPAAAPLLEHLLGNVALVESLEQALLCRERFPQYIFISLAGECIRPEGLVTGGVLEGPALGALQKKREVAELQVEVVHLEEAHTTQQRACEALQQKLQTHEAALRKLEKAQHDAELLLSSQKKDIQRFHFQLKELGQKAVSLSKEKAQADEESASLEQKTQALQLQVRERHEQRQTQEAQLQLLASKQTALLTQFDELNNAFTKLRVELATHKEKETSFKHQQQRIASELEGTSNSLHKLCSGLREDEQKLQNLQLSLAQATEALQLHEEALLEKTKVFEQRKWEHSQHLAKLREQEKKLVEDRREWEGLSKRVAELSLQCRTLSLETEHLVENAFERCGMEMDEALCENHLLLPLTAEERQHTQQLKTQLEGFGEVNLTAIAEHQALAARFAFLSQQKEDLELSIERLKKAVEKIDTQSRQQFKETFEAVNAKFAQVFPRLFGGGHAQLVLLSGLPGQEPGVDVVAQPPGKKLQALNLLSGGEKVLTAISLIFSIFLIKPTPFCLLDEVDASLDEANVHRYNELIRQMCAQSQFILVTHNKRTMEVADVLYGVTMEEPGVSKLVSVRIKELSETLPLVASA